MEVRVIGVEVREGAHHVEIALRLGDSSEVEFPIWLIARRDGAEAWRLEELGLGAAVEPLAAAGFSQQRLQAVDWARHDAAPSSASGGQDVRTQAAGRCPMNGLTPPSHRFAARAEGPLRA